MILVVSRYSISIASSYIQISSDADVRHLSDAIWTHKVIVVKGQKDLPPAKQWELVTRFDPSAQQVHSHGDIKTFNSKGGLLSVSNPSSPGSRPVNPNNKARKLVKS